MLNSTGNLVEMRFIFLVQNTFIKIVNELRRARYFLFIKHDSEYLFYLEFVPEYLLLKEEEGKYLLMTQNFFNLSIFAPIIQGQLFARYGITW